MNVVPQALREYVSPDGKNIFHAWLANLRDVKARAIIRIRLNRIRLGNFGDCKTLSGGVFELRIRYGAGYRVYFAREDNTVVLLLCGGDKSTQSRDIKRAKDYWLDYKERSA